MSEQKPRTNNLPTKFRTTETCIRETLGHYGFMGFDDTTTSGYVYVFHEDMDGAWYILKAKRSTGTSAYAAGASGSAAAFADPANQSYGTFANTF